MSFPHPPFYKWHFEMVPIEKIVEHIKEKWDPERVAELVKDISKSGLKQPLQLYLNSDGTYEIDDGNHRLKALKQLGWKEIPCMVFD
jgi:ParB-like chromosome segregation protein Spo0J